MPEKLETRLDTPERDVWGENSEGRWNYDQYGEKLTELGEIAYKLDNEKARRAALFFLGLIKYKQNGLNDQNTSDFFAVMRRPAEDKAESKTNPLYEGDLDETDAEGLILLIEEYKEATDGDIWMYLGENFTTDAKVRKLIKQYGTYDTAIAGILDAETAGSADGKRAALDFLFNYHSIRDVEGKVNELREGAEEDRRKAEDSKEEAERILREIRKLVLTVQELADGGELMAAAGETLRAIKTLERRMIKAEGELRFRGKKADEAKKTADGLIPYYNGILLGKSAEIDRIGKESDGLYGELAQEWLDKVASFGGKYENVAKYLLGQSYATEYHNREVYELAELFFAEAEEDGERAVGHGFNAAVDTTDVVWRVQDEVKKVAQEFVHGKLCELDVKWMQKCLDEYLVGIYVSGELEEITKESGLEISRADLGKWSALISRDIHLGGEELNDQGMETEDWGKAGCRALDTAMARAFEWIMVALRKDNMPEQWSDWAKTADEGRIWARELKRQIRENADKSLSELAKGRGNDAEITRQLGRLLQDYQEICDYYKDYLCILDEAETGNGF